MPHTRAYEVCLVDKRCVSVCVHKSKKPFRLLGIMCVFLLLERPDCSQEVAAPHTRGRYTTHTTCRQTDDETHDERDDERLDETHETYNERPDCSASCVCSCLSFVGVVV